MLIWKQTPPYGTPPYGIVSGGVGGWRGLGGAITPEPGPNMVWNTKYSMMGCIAIAIGVLWLMSKFGKVLELSTLPSLPDK